MKKILFFSIALVFFLNLSYTNAIGDKIKLYTFYTSSHEILFYQWFLPTLQDDFEIVPKKCDQLCKTGVFMKSGWVETMLFKVSMILEAIEENWGNVFVYADIDIQFFKPFKEHVLTLIKNKDMLIQRNRPTGEVCAGFIVCKANKRTLDLWQEVKKRIIVNNFKKSDQPMLNEIILNPVYKGVVWDYLPNEYFGAGTLVGVGLKYQWNPGDDLEIPKNIIIHHANFTKNVKNKIEQFKLIRKVVNRINV